MKKENTFLDLSFQDGAVTIDIIPGHKNEEAIETVTIIIPYDKKADRLRPTK